MSYISITEEDQIEMLDSIGVSSVDKLFTDIPKSIQVNDFLELGKPLSEIESYRYFSELSQKNNSTTSLLGAGVYNHYIPATVDELTCRSEFYTAYTPYQAEVSQGTLKSIYEFQTMVADLTGMDIANASLYDGATAVCEAVFMSVRDNRKNSIVVPDSVNPIYREVLKTYCDSANIEIKTVKTENFKTTPDQILKSIDKKTSCLLIQQPNFFGTVEELELFSEILKEKKINLITIVNEAISLGLLKTPGSCGADIVCGDMTSFGNSLSFGGPLLGFISAKEKFMRKIPGRIIGKTTDSRGGEAYVLTLQTREQHIRRERATSNICTNQGLVALRAVVYLSTVGPKLAEIAKLNHKLAVYMKNLLKDGGIEIVSSSPFFNEFVIKVDNSGKFLTELRALNISGGLNLDRFYSECKNYILICVTEMFSKDEIDSLVNKIIEVAGK